MTSDNIISKVWSFCHTRSSEWGQAAGLTRWDGRLWWKNTRRGEPRHLPALPDFSYLFVVADRGDYVLPWTQYHVDKAHRQEKYRKEHEAYWNIQKSGIQKGSLLCCPDNPDKNPDKVSGLVRPAAQGRGSNPANYPAILAGYARGFSIRANSCPFVVSLLP